MHLVRSEKLNVRLLFLALTHQHLPKKKSTPRDVVLGSCTEIIDPMTADGDFPVPSAALQSDLGLLLR